MDAQTKTSLQALKEELPKLHTLLGQCRAMIGKTDSAPPDQLKSSLVTSLKHLNQVLLWADPDAVSQKTPEKAKNPAQKPTLEAVPVDGELSDEEAFALLSQSQDDLGITSPNTSLNTPPNAAQSVTAKADDAELSDEEAMAFLTQSGETGNSEMGDDEARRLLAAMDEPLAPAASVGDAGAEGEMSDEAARKLLEDMDAPVVAPPTKPTAKPASADDEALAMLSAMGGLGDDESGGEESAAPSPRTQVGTSKSSPHGADAGDDESPGGENLVEIEEFSKNDFASDPDMMNDFGQNSDELMETLDQTILQLEQNPKDRETIESIFRAAHTLKGAAGMFGFKSMERVMHRMENLFDQVRKGILVPSADTIDVVFQGIDVLRKLLEAAKCGKPSGTPTVPIVKALELASKGKYVKGSINLGGAGGGGGQPLAAKPQQNLDSGGAAPLGDGHEPQSQKKTEQTTIRVDLERLDMLVNLVGELVIDRTRFASLDETIRTTNPQIKVAGAFSETVQLFGRHMNEIHEIIMKIRMVPIGNAFNKFTRVVRDLSRQLSKEINLDITGEDTELDKTLVEQIGDPLIHLIRNSCDHGVEMPDVRLASGKSKAGRISLSARQEGNNIIITIEDDGKGIQVDAVRKKGIERGLISEDAQLTKRDIFNLIFEAGFSTAEKVTEVSGRGVGMDVVRKQISKLKGLIDIDSEVGKGTTTTIRLPLTLAIVQSLLVETSGETFAIPLSTVIESVRIKPEEIQSVGDAEVIKRHGKVLPLMHLHEILELNEKLNNSWYVSDSHRDESGKQVTAPTRNSKRKERLFVVIVGSGDRRFGIVVDQLLHQQEMVIKSMGSLMKRVPCVAGGAVLGNGEVVLVLDVQELEDKFRMRTKKSEKSLNTLSRAM